MLFQHQNQRPEIHPTASVAPTAVLSGEITIGPQCRILHGAILTSEGGPVRIGANSIVMENALLRGTRHHPLTVGQNVLAGPYSYLSGCSIEDDVFLATRSSVFNGARIGRGSTVRIGGLVHLLTKLPPDSRVPIGWVAVGDPVSILPAEAEAEIWAALEPLDFPRVVFGVERSKPGRSTMPQLCRRYGRYLSRHDSDLPLE